MVCIGVYTNNVYALYVLTTTAAAAVFVAHCLFLIRSSFCNLFNNNDDDDDDGGNSNDIKFNEIGSERQWKWLKEGSNLYTHIQIHFKNKMNKLNVKRSLFFSKRPSNKQIELYEVEINI